MRYILQYIQNLLIKSKIHSLPVAMLNTTIPYSQAVRYKRIVSKDTSLKKNLRYSLFEAWLSVKAAGFVVFAAGVVVVAAGVVVVAAGVVVAASDVAVAAGVVVVAARVVVLSMRSSTANYS